MAFLGDLLRVAHRAPPVGSCERCLNGPTANQPASREDSVPCLTCHSGGALAVILVVVVRMTRSGTTWHWGDPRCQMNRNLGAKT